MNGYEETLYWILGSDRVRKRHGVQSFNSLFPSVPCFRTKLAQKRADTPTIAGNKLTKALLQGETIYPSRTAQSVFHGWHCAKSLIVIHCISQ